MTDQDSIAALVRAICRRDHQDIQAKLRDHPSLASAHDSDCFGATPLIHAVSQDDRTVVDLLLEAGADINQRSDWWAGSFGVLDQGTDAMAEYLLGRGATLTPHAAAIPVPPPAAGHIYMYKIGEGCSLLHVAANSGRSGVIAWLIGQGCDPNVAGGYDDSRPLHIAAWHDWVDAIDALLDGGAAIDQVSGPTHQNEPLGWAIVGGSEHAVRGLIERGARVRDTHRKDAAAGARGEFRHFNSKRPIQHWQAIEQITCR